MRLLFQQSIKLLILFFNGFASVMSDNEYYYIDQSGNILDTKEAISLGTPFGK